MMQNDNIIDIPSLQWYPGHMRKAERLVQENLKSVDVVVELLDARIPMSSANPVLREIVGGKPRLIVLNKADLADEGEGNEGTCTGDCTLRKAENG